MARSPRWSWPSALNFFFYYIMCQLAFQRTYALPDWFTFICQTYIVHIQIFSCLPEPQLGIPRAETLSVVSWYPNTVMVSRQARYSNVFWNQATLLDIAWHDCDSIYTFRIVWHSLGWAKLPLGLVKVAQGCSLFLQRLQKACAFKPYAF